MQSISISCASQPCLLCKKRENSITMALIRTDGSPYVWVAYFDVEARGIIKCINVLNQISGNISHPT